MRPLLLILMLTCASSLAAATFTVTTTADNATTPPAGSLRQALLDAAANAGPDNIVFNLSSLPATITTVAALRTIGTVTVTGPGARQLTINGGGASFQGFIIGQFGSATGNSDATLEDMTITGFWVNGGAGAAINLQNTTASGFLSSVTLNRVAVVDCRQTAAGGVVSMGNGAFTAKDCEFTACRGSTGGAINASGGILTLTSCTFSGNIASSTGGAINVTSTAGASINSCTISGNTSTNAGGGINVNGTTPTCSMVNTIVGGNISTNQTSEDVASTSTATFTSGGYNLIQVTTGSLIVAQSTDITGVSPQLTALANNGGPTNTMELAAASPCIDAGTAGSLTTDQRGTGFARTFDDTAVANVNDGTDMGAFERQPIATPQISPSGTLSPFTTSGAGVISTTQSFSVAGTALTQPITIAPPQHWEVSFTSSGTYTGFPSTISTAAPTGGVVASTTVYIRYNPAAAPPHSDTVALTSAGATPQTLSVSGVLPTISSIGVDFAGAENAVPSTATAMWRLSMSAALTVAITVNFNVGFQSSPSASPVPGEDFQLSTAVTGVSLSFLGATGNTATIPAGVTIVDILVTVVDDTVYEAASENVWFQVVAGAGYTPNANNSFVNITDNDSPPVVSVAATDNSADEGAAATDTATYTITFSNPSAFTTTLNLTMSGSADTTPSADYTLAAIGGGLSYTGPGGTITVAALTTTVTVTLTAIDDAAVEGPETATLTLNGGTDYSVGSPASDTATVVDNDVFPTITVAATDNTGSEASAATDTAVFTITLNPAPVSVTTLNFTMGGTAATASGTDYTLGATGGSLGYTGPTGTIDVGVGVTSVTVTLTVVDDAAVEGATAETATFTINSGTGYTVGSPSTDTASITDNDVAVVPTVTVSLTDGAAAESATSTNTGVYTVQLTPAPNTPLVIQFGMSGTAAVAPGTDYNLAGTGVAYTGPAGTITIAPGTTSVVVTLTTVNDALAEGITPETATFSLAAGGGYVLGTTVTGTVDITDNDTPAVSVAATDGAAAETAAGTDTGTFIITLNPAPTNATTLAFNMSGTAALATGADYTLSATGGTLTYTTGPAGTIDVGSGTTTVTVTLTVIDDAAVEGATAETATLTLVAGAGYGLGATVAASVDITDNDIPPIVITTTSLPNGAVGTAYSQPVALTGGAAPYTWSVLTGTLPPGLGLSASTSNTVTVTGNPTAAGLFSFTIQASDGISTDTQAFSVTINGGGSGGGGGGGDGGGGCTSGGGAGTIAVLALLGGLAVRARRRRA